MNEPTERSESSTATSQDDGQFQHVRDYSRAASRWVSASLTRDSIMAGLKTLLWLVPLTVLIWIYAEREQIDKPSPEAIPIQIRSSDPKRIIEPLMAGSSVIAKLSGPRSSIEQLRREIQLQPNGEASVVIQIPSSYSLGLQELDTAMLLSQTKQFASSGVTIEGCQPERLKVTIDEYVEREAEVQVPAQFQQYLVSQQTSFTPPTVKVRAPSLSLPPPEVKLMVYADLSKLPDITQTGEHKGDVPFVAPSAWKGAQIVATTVYASVESRPPESTYVINTMPFRVQETPNMLMDERKRVKLENNQLARVPVSGPPEQIEFLRKAIESAPDTPPAYAILRVERKDLFKSASSVRLEFRFPKEAEGVHVDPNYEYAKKDFEFSIADQP